MNRQQLQSKLSKVSTKLMQEKGFIAFVDVFMEMGYLEPKEYENWRMKRVPYLERVITANLNKISFIMKTLRRNCRNGNCRESWTAYHSWGKGKKVPLRFSKSGEPAIEETYATHFLKPKPAYSREKSSQTDNTESVE